MIIRSRRQILRAAAAVAALGSARVARPARADQPALRVLAAPSATVAVLAESLRDPVLQRAVATMTLDVWRTPDQMRAALVAGRADAVMMPTVVAANLFNRGLPVRLLATVSAGHMHVLTADPAVRGITDLRGRSITLYFRNDLPDLLTRIALGRNNLTPDTDVAIAYAGSGPEAAQHLLTGRADTVLLNEPAATLALARAEQAGRDLRRAFTLQGAWSPAADAPADLPLAGLVVTADWADRHPVALAALGAALVNAGRTAAADPVGAAEPIAETLGIPRAVLAEVLAGADIMVSPARTARPSLEALLASLAGVSPDLIGGGLPGADFYLAP